MTDAFYGKYRGVVKDINDPLNQMRIRARVSDVLGDELSGWAWPCFPFGGKGMGFFALPAVDSGVWMEFENGNPAKPIWSGSWVGSVADVPPQLLAPPYKKVMIKTEGGHSITLDDTPGVGGITLETASGQKITCSSLGIEIHTGGGVIKLTGPQVSINNGALEVT